MNNCSNYETKLTYAEVYNYILTGCMYVYDKTIANKRVMHLMKHGRTKRIRKKNWNRYCSGWRLFINGRIKK